MMKKLLTLVLLIAHCVIIGQTNKATESGNYKVCKIDTLKDFYLIFVTRHDERYTIYSEKGIEIKGQKVKIDSTYFFELLPKIDTLSNGKSITPLNYLDVYYFDKYSGSEIGKLCTAKNLIGLIIPDSAEVPD